MTHWHNSLCTLISAHYSHWIHHCHIDPIFTVLWSLLYSQCIHHCHFDTISTVPDHCSLLINVYVTEPLTQYALYLITAHYKGILYWHNSDSTVISVHYLLHWIFIFNIYVCRLLVASNEHIRDFKTTFHCITKWRLISICSFDVFTLLIMTANFQV